MDLKKTLGSVQSAEKIKDEEQRMIEAVREKIVKHKSIKKGSKDFDKEAVDLIAKAESKVEKEGLDTQEAAKETLEEEYEDSDDGPSIKKVTTDEIDDEDEIPEDDENLEEEKTCTDCIFSMIRFGWKMCTSALHYLSAFFDRHSREHRYVAFVLDEEKKILKNSMPEVSNKNFL
jgi:hypothetical protein